MQHKNIVGEADYAQFLSKLRESVITSGFDKKDIPSIRSWVLTVLFLVELRISNCNNKSHYDENSEIKIAREVAEDYYPAKIELLKKFVGYLDARGRDASAEGLLVEIKSDLAKLVKVAIKHELLFDDEIKGLKEGLK